MAELKPPIIVTGAHRSGTTMLYRLLSSALGMCGWYEPLTVWRIGHAYRDADNADQRDAKPWVRRRIRRLFQQFQDSHGGRRVVEKTPNNVLRLRLVAAVLPEAKIVHIYRDGRANLRSLVEKYETFRTYYFPDNPSQVSGHLLSRLRQTPFWEWPAYVPRAVHGLARSHITKKPVNVWGVRYDGWRQDRAAGLTQWQFAAKQWTVAVETALADLQSLPRQQSINLRYEDVVSNPAEWFRRIADFCEIDADEEFVQRACGSVHEKSIDKWMEQLQPQALAEGLSIMEPLLRRLNYV